MYYLEAEAAISCVISVCSVDDIDLEARSHRGLRVGTCERTRHHKPQYWQLLTLWNYGATG